MVGAVVASVIGDQIDASVDDDMTMHSRSQTMGDLFCLHEVIRSV